MGRSPMDALTITFAAVVVVIWLVPATPVNGRVSCDHVSCDNDLSNSTVEMSGADAEDAFGFLFQTNKDQMRDVPVYFKKPQSLPRWLNGTLVRNGMGQFENGPRTFTHAFDGFAKLASWKFFGNGTVLFSTRFIQTNFYRDSMEQNTIAPYLLFQSVNPPFGLFEKFRCLLNGLDNMNVNVYRMRHPKTKKFEYVALSDYWILYRINIDRLSTLHRLTPELRSTAISIASASQRLGSLNLLSSAHPLPEPGTNNVLTYLCDVGVVPWESNRMSLIRIKSWKRRKVIASWKLDQMPYMHSFSVTQTKAILLEMPFYVNILCMAVKVMPFDCITYYPEKPSILHIVDLSSGAVTTIKLPSVFTMHHVNAYDYYNDQIIMDISTYPSPQFVRHLELAILRDPTKRNSFEARARLKRITINLRNNTASIANIGQDPDPGLASLLDMPVINENYRSKHYCYVYGIVVKTDNITLGKIAVVKKDLCHNGLYDRVWQDENIYPAEPWFVPRPQAILEDDGILMVQVLQGLERKCYLIMLDAMTMTVLDQAETPTTIPYSLHGRFFTADD